VEPELVVARGKREDIVCFVKHFGLKAQGPQPRSDVQPVKPGSNYCKLHIFDNWDELAPCLFSLTIIHVLARSLEGWAEVVCFVGKGLIVNLSGGKTDSESGPCALAGAASMG
jgi:hypothetical protein